MNRSKDLRNLFRQSLINERKRPKINFYNCGVFGNVHSIPSQYGCNSIRVFFYEWSDPKKAPRIFYQLDAFDNFLKSSGIYLEFFQKDIIKNLGTVYVTCFTGTKTLNIRGSYKSMLDALAEHDKKRLVSSIQKPHLIFESSQGRWPENDGTFFG
jgi:hypothetical protein